MVGFWTLLALVLFLCLAGGIWGADSRPGLGDERPDRKAPWFYHSKAD